MRKRIIERLVRWLIKRYLSDDYHLHANPARKVSDLLAPVPEYPPEFRPTPCDCPECVKMDGPTPGLGDGGKVSEE